MYHPVKLGRTSAIPDTRDLTFIVSKQTMHRQIYTVFIKLMGGDDDELNGFI